MQRGRQRREESEDYGAEAISNNPGLRHLTVGHAAGHSHPSSHSSSQSPTTPSFELSPPQPEESSSADKQVRIADEEPNLELVNRRLAERRGRTRNESRSRSRSRRGSRSGERVPRQRSSLHLGDLNVSMPISTGSYGFRPHSPFLTPQGLSGRSRPVSRSGSPTRTPAFTPGHSRHGSRVNIKTVNSTPNMSRSASSARIQRIGSDYFQTLSTRMKRMDHTTAHTEDSELLETYGLEELREGYFDAIFEPARKAEENARMVVLQMREKAQAEANQVKSPIQLFLGMFVSTYHAIRTTLLTKNGITVLKAFLAYFVGFLLCIIHPTARWLGPHCYFLPIATILHHPGRRTGSQIEITVQCIVGQALGMGIGALALYVSDSTTTARKGHGGLLAVAVIPTIAVVSWMRACYIRLYHGFLSMGIALLAMTDIDVSSDFHWRSAWDFGIPYLFGMLLPVVINLLIIPSIGQGDMVTCMADALSCCRDCVHKMMATEPGVGKEAQDALNAQSIALSDIHRNMCNEIMLTTFSKDNVRIVRNLIQTVIGHIRIVDLPCEIFSVNVAAAKEDAEEDYFNQHPHHAIPDMAPKIFELFQEGARDLVLSIMEALTLAEEFIKNIRHPPEEISLKFQKAMTNLQHKMNHLDAQYTKLIVDQQELNISRRAAINALFVQRLSHCGHAVFNLLRHLHGMSLETPHWRLSLPRYPWKRALTWSNTQSLHDRGGKTAGHYFRVKAEVEEIFHRTFNMNTSRHIVREGEKNQKQQMCVNAVDHSDFDAKHGDISSARYKLWKILHRLQRFESKFAVKTTIAVTLLSLPGWLEGHDWYQHYDAFWAPILVLISLHPRAGGNAHDLIVRTVVAIIGAVFGALAAGIWQGHKASPYIMGVFCAVFMIPCLYRFTVSNHPRSGLMGCLSFTIVALGIYTDKLQGPKRWRDANPVTGTWTRALGILIGLWSAILISWILWPFVARTESRVFTADMLGHVSQCYQIVADRYLYHDLDDDPTTLAIELSQIREARMRQGFQAYRELILSTRHEPSLRGDFPIQTYLALFQSCEHVFNRIVEARISSVYFRIYEFDETKETTAHLLSYRRDAIAATIMVLFIIADCYRARRPVPRYLPSSKMARKRLFQTIASLETIMLDESDNETHVQDHEKDAQKMASILAGSRKVGEQPVFQNPFGKTDESGEKEKTEDDVSSPLAGPLHGDSVTERKRKFWTIIHESAFATAFTDISEELEKIVGFSKSALGEET
ncbi:hypothetical protein B0I73DRAFT_129601 [Yarrowia lipolytica]|uniref:Uncharacterized protein n=1 Tax=Yarrowia lipolytica TaxID=4952 RepID=A0A371CF18_YARLL|nr:hypothetical protein B0I71DRAFT_126834 [Yarrowia lipolytica]RDW40938.1 hypothetical protein B0I73DRAFT_129601 [Yarrowia lipolytica]